MASPAKHASAFWIYSSSNMAKKNEPLRSVIVMKIDDGWHTYWRNPGAAGIPPKLEATLPEGWSIGEIQYPAPMRFTTAGLPGFGYENEVRLPVTITPPRGFTGKIPEIKGTLSWLTCNDASCVPGKAEVSLTPARSPKLIDESYNALPKPLKSANLSFSISEETVQLSLQLTGTDPVDLNNCEVFCATPEVIDPAAKPRFEPVPDKPKIWIAEAGKNEYLFEKPESVALLLKYPDGTIWEVTSVD